ncbi:LLM class flavin-dependent oxidoreductase [Saccharothrix sp.]|uniref:LLM class flavin-dependent oxidoreductase n=1 Tax=Saccharothrix sp. TaxID=1873460 RepID=UPI00281114F7|nr:LLM class flavin-dependent oxidoreductase [Saccharothrix sp.]
MKQIHLAAHFPGVNNTTVWSDPRAGSHIEFESFVHFARTAERARFDFLFLAEGLRLREQNGLIYDLDVVGRPDTFTVLAGLAAVTTHLGLTGTINSTFNEPFEVARQFVSLDHLSGGRAAWNVVTSWDAFTGENFRRGGFLPEDQRYERARRFLDAATTLFDSWRDGGEFSHRDEHFDIAGRFDLPRSPQGRPVILQAGGLGGRAGVRRGQGGRDLQPARDPGGGAGVLRRRQAAAREVRADAGPAQGAARGHLRAGDTDAQAQELAHEVRRQQVSGQTAIKFLEQVWNRDLSAYDPDGRCPTSTRWSAGRPPRPVGPACGSTAIPSPPCGSGGSWRR